MTEAACSGRREASWATRSVVSPRPGRAAGKGFLAACRTSKLAGTGYSESGAHDADGRAEGNGRRSYTPKKKIQGARVRVGGHVSPRMVERIPGDLRGCKTKDQPSGIVRGTPVARDGRRKGVVRLGDVGAALEIHVIVLCTNVAV